MRRLLLLVLVLLPTVAAAQTTRWTLTTADFQSRQVDLESISADGAMVKDTPANPARLISLDQFLALDRAMETEPPGGKLILHLASGDQLRGEPLKIDGERLIWSALTLGQLDLPLNQVAAIARSPQASFAPATEDIVTLANGDSVRGVVSALADKQITIQVAGNATPIPLDSVAAIQFASTATADAPHGRAFRVRLADNSLITAQTVQSTGDQLSLTIAGAARPVPLASVAAIEQINGPVSWLSSRTPSENVHIPLLQTSRPARMDKTIAGQPIRFGERIYARGIGVTPNSRITWALDPAQGYKSLRTQYAIDGAAPYADVTVRILLDGSVVHEKQSVTAGRLSPVILVPLGNAKSITLEADFGGNYNVQDHLNWIEPALTRRDVAVATTRP